MTKPNTHDLLNFSQDEQMLDFEHDRWWDKSKSRVKISAKNLKTKQGLMVGLLIITTLLIVISLTLEKPQQLSILENIEQTEIQVEPDQISDLEKQIQELKMKLKLADPAIKELPFPVLELALTVD